MCSLSSSALCELSGLCDSDGDDEDMLLLLFLFGSELNDCEARPVCVSSRFYGRLQREWNKDGRWRASDATREPKFSG